MSDIKPVNYDSFRAYIPDFVEKTAMFHDGTMNLKEYKGFSGKFGSYAQRGGKKHMLRLRMTAGRLTSEKLRFVADMAEEYDVSPIHYTTCQTVQFHNLDPEVLPEIMDKSLDAKIVWYGGGGDYPRNVMASPLSGTEDEYFDIMPYADAAAEFLLDFIDQDKMPRKLKVAFSNNEANVTHATFRDLGFVARPDQTFDVYCAGGLGKEPRLGVKVAQKVKPDQILYYIEAMIRMFRKNGNYDNRNKARTRFMQETLTSEEFQKEYDAALEAVRAEKDLTLTDLDLHEISKQPDGEPLEESFLVRKQKQDGLYSVYFHPKGGIVSKETMKALADAIEKMDDVEIRICPDESSYIINLTADEARKILSIVEKEAAKTVFETSNGCIGASICQVGLRDSQAVLQEILDAVADAEGIADDALPQIHISGCMSSCAAHQVYPIGFRGNLKVIDKKPVPAFSLFLMGNEKQGTENISEEAGVIAQSDLGNYLVKVGQMVTESGLSFDEWLEKNPNALKELAEEFFI